ncbi:unnamed protein product [Fusarium venenatum]|uniref:Uncharacterized protein n=1 Tax=Fusarium venenatum TaxID=56646 RepID=A0A2L2TJ34_9HYPO|nr:uncharacterized protein FVRRES_00939 [Fusarium venenatum]CEI64427.1 unnamed protein product [Fusarium venenatum]
MRVSSFLLPPSLLLQHGTTPALCENEHKPRPDRTLACSKPKVGHPMGMDNIDPRNQGMPVNEGILLLSDSINPSHPFDNVGAAKVTQPHCGVSSWFSSLSRPLSNGNSRRKPKIHHEIYELIIAA